MSRAHVLKSAILLLSILFFISNFTCAQESNQDLEIDISSEESPDVVLEEEASSLKEIKWVWGEVIGVDSLKEELSIRYLDYDSDAEKDRVFIFDKDSKFENITSLENIEAGDSAGIDYYIDETGKNIIKSISIEKLNIP
ncbi:MAG: hypothetical protein KJ593_00745 [Candidatus Omnitrophica bacterium]|nr:hypothetical protein [Candidatus Omnitrophota bacterium]